MKPDGSRRYELNDHGRRTYMTAAEHWKLEALENGGWALLWSGVAIRVIWKRRRSGASAG